MQNYDKNNYLAEEKVSKLLMKFSIPCILSLLISSIYNMVDQIFIGNSELGYLGNAATGIVYPIIVISLAFAWCFGDGIASYLSICQGKQDTKYAHKCVGSGITITFITGVALVLLCLPFQEDILRLFGASDATIDMAMDYGTITIVALPLYMVMNMLNAIIRADGSPAYSMISIAAGAVVNLILDPLFIFGFHWGMKGAAYATIIGQIVSFIVSAVYFKRSKLFKLTLKSFIPDLSIFKEATMLGISTFITQLSVVVVTLVCNVMLAKHGELSIYGPDIPISVISVASKVFSIVINIIVGIVLGAQPILGYNYGAKRFDRVKEIYKIVLYVTAVIGLISTAIFIICPQVVIRMFGTGSDLYNEFAVMTFRIFLSLVSCTCIIKMTSIFFQAVGHPTKAAILSIARDIVCFIPLAIVLSKYSGVKGILYAAPFADFIAIVITAYLTMKFMKSLKDEDMMDDDDSDEELMEEVLIEG